MALCSVKNHSAMSHFLSRRKGLDRSGIMDATPLPGAGVLGAEAQMGILSDLLKE